MNLPVNVAIGDSSPVWNFGNQGDDGETWAVLDSNYVGRISVLDTLISRTVTTKTTDSLYFVAALTSAETAGLTRGVAYQVCLQIENATLIPPFAKEIKIPIFMVIGGIN